MQRQLEYKRQLDGQMMIKQELKAMGTMSAQEKSLNKEDLKAYKIKDET